MHYTIKSASASDLMTDCLIVPIWADKQLSKSAQEIDQISGGYVSQWLTEGDMEGNPNQILMLYKVPQIKASRVLLIGCGEINKFNPTLFQQIISTSLKYVGLTGAKNCAAYMLEFVLPFDQYWQYRQAIIYAEQAFYRYDSYKSEKEPFPKALQTVDFITHAPIEAARAKTAHDQGIAIADSVKLVSDLANTPCN